MRRQSLESLSSTIRSGLGRGLVIKTAMRSAWDISGDCSEAFVRTLFARPSGKLDKYVEIVPGRQGPLELELRTRCHKCSNCLRARANMWRHRMRHETTVSSRTWFFTLTLTPDQQFRALSRARHASDIRAGGFDDLPAGMKFRKLCESISPDVTKWLKRIRKNSGARFRYCIVHEAHLGGGAAHGKPHLHGLLHEVSTPIRHALLSRSWVMGHTNFKLVTSHQMGANYVSKYLSKAMLARVRASKRYGETWLDKETVTRLLRLIEGTESIASMENSVEADYQRQGSHPLAIGANLGKETCNE